MAKEVHIVIENGLVSNVYCDKNVEVFIYDLDSTDDEYLDIIEKELKKVKEKYLDQGCNYVNPEELKEE